MRIALDTSALDPMFRAHAIRGTGRYVAELYRRLPPLLHEADSDLLSFRYHESGRGGIVDSLVDYLPAGRTTVRHQLLYPLSLNCAAVRQSDLLHFPVHADAPTWCRKPFVVTVLDLIPLIFKELYAPKKNDARFRFARWLELQSIRNAQMVLAISECTANDVHSLLGIPREKIAVTPLGVDPSFFEHSAGHEDLFSKWNLPEGTPVVLYVGGIDQRKNIAFMLEAFAEVLQERRLRQQREPVLIMAGEIRSDAQYPLVEQAIARFGLEQSIRMPGFVSDEELRMLYRGADVFFYPSLYEGFGLPPLEAMASGAPVVCSDTSSLPEVVGDTALRFSPKRVDDAANKLSMVLQCGDLRSRMAEKGKQRAFQFTWEKTAQLTAEAYFRALKRDVPSSLLKKEPVTLHEHHQIAV
jgi:glycosyltransferase involved in cell wall biosynthesis